MERILPFVDWIGLDIKAPLDERYDRITGIKGSAERVLTSLKLVLKAGTLYQLRTTLHPKLLSSQDLEDLHRQLQQLGTTAPIIQQFRIQGCLDAELVANAS